MGTRCVPKNSLNIIAKPTALCNNEIPPVCGDVAVSSSNPVSSSSHETCEGREREAYAGRWARAQGPAKREDALGRNARARKTRRAQDARARRARGGGAGRASPQDALGRTRKSAQGAGRGTRDARRAGRAAYMGARGAERRALGAGHKGVQDLDQTRKRPNSLRILHGFREARTYAARAVGYHTPMTKPDSTDTVPLESAAPATSSLAAPGAASAPNSLAAPGAASAPHMQRNLVMVVHASVGSGHRSAAKAVAQALELMRQEGDPAIPSDLEVEVIDILEWGRHKFDGDRTASMFVGATRPIYDLTWRYTFTGRLLWGGGTVWSHLMYAPFTKFIAEKRPCAVIATHITGANAAVAARMITGQDFPVISVPTDYETEGLWPHRATDLFCVGTEPMAETLIRSWRSTRGTCWASC